MPKQHYRYSYDTIDIFQKICDYYVCSALLNVSLRMLSGACQAASVRYTLAYGTWTQLGSYQSLCDCLSWKQTGALPPTGPRLSFSSKRTYKV